MVIDFYNGTANLHGLCKDTGLYDVASVRHFKESKFNHGKYELKGRVPLKELCDYFCILSNPVSHDEQQESSAFEIP